jgi:hypothetical protein
MSARAAAALPRSRLVVGVRRRTLDVLAFTEPGAPLVAVCGLHGGAGATTLTALLAEHAAAASPAGRVLALEGDARAGQLAMRLGAASGLSLAQLATERGSDPGVPVAQRSDGLRVLAAAGPDLATAGASTLARVLAEARAAHGLCVVDAGCVRHPAAEPVLAGADVVVWVSDPDRLTPAPFASPLVRPARGARWVLALVATNGRRTGPRLPRALRDELAAVVALRGRKALEGKGARAAAEQLARAVRG